MAKETAHAQLGASNAHRWTVCKRSPSFISELQTAGIIPLATYNKYAAEGTVAHTVADQHIRCDVKTVCGDVVQQDGFDIEVTNEMLNAVMVYVKYMRQQMAPGIIVKTEHQLSITDDLWGTTDALVIKPYKRLEIVDYKHGSGKFVPVEDNIQLKFYAAAAWGALPADLKAEITTIRTTIVQPRHYMAEGNEHGGVWSYDYTPDVIEEFRNWIIAEATQVSPDADLVVGDHCQWCPAALHCPARLSHHSSKIGMMLDKADSVEKVPPPLPVSALSDAQILTVVENADLIREYLDTAEQWLKSRLQAGAEIPGWTLKTNYGHKKWIDPAKVEDAVKDLGAAAFTLPVLKTPAQMAKAAAAAKLEVDLESLTTREISSYKLVKSDAPGSDTLPQMLIKADLKEKAAV